MTRKVLVTAEAKADLADICAYVAENDAPEKAVRLLASIEAACADLAHHAGRGQVPRELDRLGIQSYRQVHFKPYRIVNEIVASSVLILAVIDGRRDVQDLLQRRLMR